MPLFSIGHSKKSKRSGSVKDPSSSKATQMFQMKHSGPRSQGDQTRSSSKKFEDYERMRVELTNDAKLWEDPDFRADDSSLFPNTAPGKATNIRWLRPGELCESPHLFTDGMSRFDIQQGEIGDCWFLAAVASLSMCEDLIERVVPNDQGFDKRRYCGAFFFRFWRFGQWQEVIVDDRLPTKNGRLIFMHSKEKNEFWSALLEKAYAKVNGSYENLAGGSQSEAMEDFTGGLCESFDLATPPKNFYRMMLKNSQRKSLMGCAIESDTMGIEGELPNGLITGHAYSITDVRKVKVRGTDHELIRIRNPWGQSEWKGAWSDDSDELKLLTAQQKADLGLVNENDGEFWMSCKDFVNNFTKLEVCHLSPDDEDEIDDDDLVKKSSSSASKAFKRKWQECMEVGEWIKNVSAGGCRNFIGSFASNPQFRVEVIDPDEDDDEDLGTLVLGLMQKDVRSRGLDYNTIGYAIYLLRDPSCGRLETTFFKTNKMAARSPQYINSREICGRHKLKPGHYVIIPSTFQPGNEGEFLMRIFSETKNNSNEIDESDAFTPLPDIMAKATVALSPANFMKLKETFHSFSGPTGQINAWQLKDILNATVTKELHNFDGFRAEVCRSLVALYDIDQTGKIEFDEFTRLWGDLRLWKSIFLEYDADKNGSFDCYEFRSALDNSGFKLSNQVFQVMAMRYTDPVNGVISFEDFLLAIIRLRTAFENFEAQPKDKQGNSSFPLNTFLRICMYV